MAFPDQSRGRGGGGYSLVFVPIATLERSKGSKEVPPASREAMRVLVEAGMTNRFIASRIELPLSTAAAIAARVRRKGTAARRRRAVRPRFLSARDGRHLQILVYRHRTCSLDQLTAAVSRIMTHKMCSRTVRRCLHRAFLLNYAAVTKPYLTSRHVSQRLRWALNTVSWPLSR